MNRSIILFTGIIFLFSFTLKSQDYFNLNSDEFKNTISENKGTLLDVRTNGEFLNGHIKGSGQLNYYSFSFKQKLLLLPKNQPVYLYCNTGYRSRKAAEFLAENGYKEVYNLKHGIMEWELNDFPVIVDPNAKPDTKDKMEADEYYALIQSDKKVFIDFYAPWCAPCRKMLPMIDSLKTEYKDKVTIVKINADASKKLIKELKVASVPYLVMYDNGKLLYEHNGLVKRRQLEKVLNSSN